MIIKIIILIILCIFATRATIKKNGKFHKIFTYALRTLAFIIAIVLATKWQITLW